MLVLGVLWLYARHTRRTWAKRAAQAVIQRELLLNADSALLRKVLGSEFAVPPWVLFPDTERAEWLNSVLSGMWKGTLQQILLKA